MSFLLWSIDFIVERPLRAQSFNGGSGGKVPASGHQIHGSRRRNGANRQQHARIADAPDIAGNIAAALPVDARKTPQWAA